MKVEHPLLIFIPPVTTPRAFGPLLMQNGHFVRWNRLVIKDLYFKP